MMFASRVRCAYRFGTLARRVSTLSSNPHIKVFPLNSNPDICLLTYLDNDPPREDLAIGTTTSLPPTPRSFTENRRFVSILNEVLSQHAHNDDDLISQAKAFAGPGGSTLASSGALGKNKNVSAGMGGGGGAGGGGVGGWVHLSDLRNLPDFGRIAWPEDILGSVEVDSEGNIIGQFQPSGTYRLLTNEGILGLSSYLRCKLVERLREE